VTKETIARELRELLNLPPTEYSNIRCSKEYRLIGVVLNTITNALWRGESVRIAGFGIFRVRTRKATRHGVPYRHKDIDETVGNGKPPEYRGVWKVRDIPERKYVHFQPSRVLLRMINGNQQ
jgi:nucleoid DNA-binding protein